jgi:hypothetical protein
MHTGGKKENGDSGLEAGGFGRERLAIDFFAMSHPENQHNHAVIFDFANHTVISDAVPPVLAEARTGQSLSDAAWVIQLSNSLMEKFQDAPTVLRIESVEVSLGVER